MAGLGQKLTNDHLGLVVPALAEMMARDREDAPLGGVAGELATPAPEPQAPTLQRPMIPPPPWSG